MDKKEQELLDGILPNKVLEVAKSVLSEREDIRLITIKFLTLLTQKNSFEILNEVSSVFFEVLIASLDNEDTNVICFSLNLIG